MRRAGHQLVRPPVESERRRTEPPPHDQVVDLEREIVRDLGGGEPASVVHELPEGGAIREQAHRRRPADDQDDGIEGRLGHLRRDQDRKSTRLNSSHVEISYAVFCLKKKKKTKKSIYSTKKKKKY